MTGWTRVRWPMRCGGCGAELALGAAVRVLELAGLRRRLVRGVCCAGPAPPELPALVQQTAPPKPFTMARFTVDMLPLDFKQRQMREPWCDDE